MTEEFNDNPYRIRITASEDSPLALENLSSFLYDLVLVHHRLLLFFNGDYYHASLSGLTFNRRGGRRIEKSERLQISLINKQSPLVIEVAVATAILAWTLIQILRALSDWEIDTRIKEEQLRKLVLENSQISKSVQSSNYYVEFEKSLVKDAHRLGNNEQVSIKEVEDLSDS